MTTTSKPNKGKNRTYHILPRFPIDPIFDYLEGGDAWDNHPSNGGHQPQSKQVRYEYVARRCGVTRQTVVRWNKVGLNLYQADQIAVKLGKHPAQIWPDWMTAKITTEVR